MPEHDVDIWRDTPLRYLGYANEIGEGFRPIVPQLVIPSYAVAVAYVLADTGTKYSTADERRKRAEEESGNGPAAAAPSPAAVAIDTVTWQMLASVAIPGLMINRTVWFAKQGVDLAPRLPKALPLRALLCNPTVKRWLPTAVGLAVIPLIVEPIDKCESFVQQARGVPPPPPLPQRRGRGLLGDRVLLLPLSEPAGAPSSCLLATPATPLLFAGNPSPVVTRSCAPADGQDHPEMAGPPDALCVVKQKPMM